jgi:alpha-beta hydrolase superfamily lysophospholipase
MIQKHSLHKFGQLLCISLSLTACMPTIHPIGKKIQAAQLLPQQFVTEDNQLLPMRSWLPPQKITAVLIAIHGFNDYSGFFATPAQYLQQREMASYSYDLRGFGNTQHRGLWAGYETYQHDLITFIDLIHEKHPQTPIYLLGESMGAAVVITAAATHKLPIAGIILSAPAIWSRDTMPWYQQLLLWSLSYTLPWLTLTGESVGVLASDNIAMLRALGRDPLVIKETRVEAVHGLADLMDAAMEQAGKLSIPTLVLYGQKDEIIPASVTLQFIAQFSPAAQTTIACYKNGYHLLLRDLQAKIVWDDLRSWITADKKSLPSKAEQNKACLSDKRVEKP